MSLDSIRQRAATCDLPDCDIKALLAVADAAAPFLRFVADMREHGKTNVVVDIEAIADALAALEAQK